MRALSYNVRSLRDDGAAVAAVIRDLAVDVVLIQEAPRFWGWKAKLATLASDADMVYVTGGRSARAMAILCDLDVRVVSRHQLTLSWTVGLHRRGVAAAILKVRGQRVGVASFHLGLRADERLQHAQQLVRSLREIDATVPWVIGGDLNEEPGAPAWSVIAADRQDALLAAADPLGELTYSATDPVRRIDAIFCPPTARVLTAGVPEHPGIAIASDHRPVLAELTL